MIDDKLCQYATERDLEMLKAVEAEGSEYTAAKMLGISRSTVNKAMRRLRQRAARQGYAPEHDLRHPVPEGFYLRGASVYYDKNGNPTQQWVKSQIDHERQAEIFREACAAMSETLPRVSAAPYTGKTAPDLCNLIVFSDYHIGQMAWGREAGADWDLKIAEQLLLASFLHMVSAAPAADTCVLCLQGDTLDVDSILPVTPAHHNILDVDGRFSKIIDVAIRVIRQLVDYSLAKHAKVHLIVAEGNHDESSSRWLCRMLAAIYENEPRLTVNDSELPFYTFQFEEVMLGFHHGHKVRNEDLPLLFAAQFPALWGATRKRYVHTGHRHHVDEKEYSGVTVIQHPTLAARNAYAARGGWIADRAASVITYHKRYGQVARNTVTPEMFAEVVA